MFLHIFTVCFCPSGQYFFIVWVDTVRYYCTCSGNPPESSSRMLSLKVCVISQLLISITLQLDYGPMQLVVKIAQKILENGLFREKRNNIYLLQFFSHFFSSQEASAKYEYLLRCSLDQLSCDPKRWHTMPVCNSALTAGNQQSLETGKHSKALPVHSILEIYQKNL